MSEVQHTAQVAICTFHTVLFRLELKNFIALACSKLVGCHAASLLVAAFLILGVVLRRGLVARRRIRLDGELVILWTRVGICWYYGVLLPCTQSGVSFNN